MPWIDKDVCVECEICVDVRTESAVKHDSEKIMNEVK